MVKFRYVMVRNSKTVEITRKTYGSKNLNEEISYENVPVSFFVLCIVSKLSAFKVWERLEESGTRLVFRWITPALPTVRKKLT